MNVYKVILVVCESIALIMLIISYATPMWWTYETSYETTFYRKHYKTNGGLWKICGELNIGNVAISSSCSTEGRYLSQESQGHLLITGKPV